VFERPIGQRQGIQFPIAQAYARVRAADLARYEAARLFDAGHPCGAEANMANCSRPMRPGGGGERLFTGPKRF
jgi:alkylation response protein AidB-like acyl-CoA dehydrogenase